MNGQARVLLTLTMALTLTFSIWGCSNNDNPVTPSDLLDTSTGTVFGKVTYQGGIDFSGINVTLEPIDSSGMTKTVANITTMQKAAQGTKLLKKSGNSDMVMRAGLNAEMRETISQKDGSYRFENVPLGQYSLRAKKSENHFALVKTVIVNDSGPTMVNPVLTPTGTIAGRVIMEGATDHSGFLAFISGTSYVSMTNSTGSYFIIDVPVGTYSLSISAPGFPLVSKNVTLSAIGSITNVDTVYFRKYGSLVGKVSNFVTHEPIAQAQVHVLGGDSTWTDQQGLFKINCPSGSARLSVRNSYFYSEDIYVDKIAAGEITTIPNDIALNRLPFTGQLWPQDQIWTSRNDTISLDVSIPINATLTIEAGVIINGMIHVNGGSLRILGNPAKYVTFTNAGGINCEGRSTANISYAFFKGAGSGVRGIGFLGGECIFQNCRFDKAYINCTAAQYDMMTFLNSTFTGSLEFYSQTGQAEFISCLFSNIDNTQKNGPMFYVHSYSNLFVRKSKIIRCQTNALFRSESQTMYGRILVDSTEITDNTILQSVFEKSGFVLTNNIIKNNNSYKGQPFASLAYTQLSGNIILNNTGFASGGIIFDCNSKSWGNNNIIAFPGIDAGCYQSEGGDIIGDTVCTFSGYTSPENAILSFTHIATQKIYYAHSLNGKYTDAMIPTGVYQITARATGYVDSTLENFLISGETRDYLNFILTKTP